MDLLELAERVERASGADRDIDGWIAVALDPERQTVVGQEPGRFPRKAIYGPIAQVMEVIGGKEGADYIGASLFTASLDAAMTLIPEGMGQGCFFLQRSRSFACIADVWTNAEFNRYEKGKGATPALALCAAALKAQARARGEG
jgi:hypothetical protein